MTDFDSARQLARAAELRDRPFARREPRPRKLMAVVGPDGADGVAALDEHGTAVVRLRGSNVRAELGYRWA